MTLPDKLVTAAAEALVDAGVFEELATPSAEDLARAALAAAFDALPACEEVQPRNVTSTMAAGWRECLVALAWHARGER